MTWVKICGITNLEDALMAVDAGADALGFVLYDQSPRRIDPETVRRIVARLPQNLEKVGLFVDPSEEDVGSCATSLGITAAQVYVDSEPTATSASCPHCFEQLVRRIPQIKLIPALSMSGERPEGPAMMWAPDAVYAFLLDSRAQGKLGGSGQQFDWEASQTAVATIATLSRVIVAGGLNADNVAKAIHVLKPWGVDVSSGVEAAPGKKDHNKLRAFVDAVRMVDREG